MYGEAIMKKNPDVHRTALKRTEPSAPLRLLLSRNEITGRVLDYGCGHGQDVEHLSSLGFAAVGYDPHRRPAKPRGRFDTVLCTYVLNVVPATEGRCILESLLYYNRGRVFITTRLDVAETKTQRLVTSIPWAQRYTSGSGFQLWLVE